MKTTSEQKRILRKKRIRAKVSGTALRPRLSVFRGAKSMFVQLIDDGKSVTLASVSEKELTADQKKKPKAERAHVLGGLLAKKAKEKGIVAVVFDRGGSKYHGRVKAVADGAREGGLAF
ncbi:MAG: 50S ribosomal protein L18 [bacterium]|nr:50S ribosomal protein L18 [bacterium]